MSREQGNIFSREFPCAAESTKAAIDFLDGIMENRVFSAETSSKAGIIADEIISNILRHSGSPSFGVSVSFDDGSRSVTLSFTDEGAEFNPLSHADPDTALSADDRPIGGLGILMVKNLADEVSYERVGGRNILKAKIIQKAASTEKPQLREV